MSEALVGAKVILAADGVTRLSTVGVGTRSKGDKYDPDREAYDPGNIDGNATEEPVRSPMALFLERAEAGKASADVVVWLRDGKRIQIELNEAQVKSAFNDKKLVDVLVEARREHIIAEGVRRLEEAERTGNLREAQRLREDGPYNDDDFGNAGSAWFNGLGGYQADQFLPLGNGPFNRQLYLHDMWSMQAKAFYARTHDPVAKAGLEIVVDFTLGRGYSVVAADPRVQKEWDEYWKINRGDEKLPTWLMDGQTDGNMFHRFFRQVSAPPKVATLDATTIWEIITDPENVDDPKLYWQQYQTPYSLYSLAGEPTYKYVIRQIPADEILHTKLNASATEKFGRSDLFPVLGWLKRLRDYYDAETLKAMIQAAFAWWFKIEGSGADVQAVQAFAQTLPPPDLKQPGQAFYTNEAVSVEALQADKINTTTGGIGIGDGLLSVIAVGLRLAKDYFGVTSRGSIGSDPSKTATEPSIKHFENRQKLLRNLLQRMAEKVIRIAQVEGRLPMTTVKAIGVKDIIATLRKGDLLAALKQTAQSLRGGEVVPLDTGIDVIFPPIVREDRQKLIADTERAESNNWISKRQGANIVARGFDMGNYDFDETQDEIAEESSGKTTAWIARTGEQVQKGQTSPYSPYFPPGVVINPAGGPTQESAKRVLTIELGDE